MFQVQLQINFPAFGNFNSVANIKTWLVYLTEYEATENMKRLILRYLALQRKYFYISQATLCKLQIHTNSITHLLLYMQFAGFKYLIVPVGEGRGLIRWAMLSGMFIVKGEIWGCTGFTGDSGASCFSLFSLDRAVNVILMFVLGNLKVHLKNKNKYISNLFINNVWNWFFA